MLCGLHMMRHGGWVTGALYICIWICLKQIVVHAIVLPDGLSEQSRSDCTECRSSDARNLHVVMFQMRSGYLATYSPRDLLVVCPLYVFEWRGENAR